MNPEIIYDSSASGLFNQKPKYAIGQEVFQLNGMSFPVGTILVQRNKILYSGSSMGAHNPLYMYEEKDLFQSPGTVRAELRARADIARNAEYERINKLFT